MILSEPAAVQREGLFLVLLTVHFTRARQVANFTKCCNMGSHWPETHTHSHVHTEFSKTMSDVNYLINFSFNNVAAVATAILADTDTDTCHLSRILSCDRSIASYKQSSSLNLSSFFFR